MSEFPKPRITWTYLNINIETRQIVSKDGVAPSGEIYTDLWIPYDTKPEDEIKINSETEKILSSKELKLFGFRDTVDYENQPVACWILGEPLNTWKYDKATGILISHDEKFHYDHLQATNVPIGKSIEQKIPYVGMQLRYNVVHHHVPYEFGTLLTDYKFTSLVDDHTIECVKIDYPVEPLQRELLERTARLETEVSETSKHMAQLEGKLEGSVNEIRNDLNRLESRREFMINTISIGILVSLTVGLTLTFLFWLIGVFHVFP